MRYFLRILSLFWACFWVYFGLNSGIMAKESVSLLILHTTVPGLIFLASVYVAWRWQTVGGLLLILEGLIAFFGFPNLASGILSFQAIISIMMIMAFPPLITGTFFIVDDNISKLNKGKLNNGKAKI